MNQKIKWEKEYSLDKGVPTTTRTNPSSSVVKAIKYIESKKLLKGKKVVDLGCGTGRNTFYLAKKGYSVFSVDFIDQVLKELNIKANKLDLQNRIHTKNASMGKKLPFKDSSFDLALDIVSSMSLNSKQMKVFEKELRRILVNGGVFVSYILSEDDGYMLKFGDKKSSTYLSPQSSIVEHCRSEKDIKQIYSKWEFLKFKKVEMKDDYYGKKYLRRLWWFILKNNK